MRLQMRLPGTIRIALLRRVCQMAHASAGDLSDEITKSRKSFAPFAHLFPDRFGLARLRAAIAIFDGVETDIQGSHQACAERVLRVEAFAKSGGEFNVFASHVIFPAENR